MEIYLANSFVIGTKLFHWKERNNGMLLTVRTLKPGM